MGLQNAARICRRDAQRSGSQSYDLRGSRPMGPRPGRCLDGDGRGQIQRTDSSRWPVRIQSAHEKRFQELEIEVALPAQTISDAAAIRTAATRDKPASESRAAQRPVISDWRVSAHLPERATCSASRPNRARRGHTLAFELVGIEKRDNPGPTSRKCAPPRGGALIRLAVGISSGFMTNRP